MNDRARLCGRTMVIVSTQDWDDLHTRKQRFARRFADGGCRVLYVEAQWHWLSYLKNRSRARVRLRQAGRPPRPHGTNLWLWTPPPQLPFFQIWEPLAHWNNRRLGPQLCAAVDAIGGEARPLLYVYTPYNSFLIDSLKPAATVYECVDDYAAARGLIRARTVERLEWRTLQKAQACVVTAQALFEQRRSKIANLHLIPNAADVDFFARAACAAEDARIASLPRPRLGLVGAVNYWIDLALLRHVALSRPKWQIVVVGPVAVRYAGFSRLPNVHLLGRVPYQSLPEIVAGFDVCLVPYVMDDVARGCSPLKLYEYLASGKPVVSVPMPEALRFAPPVLIGEDYTKFVEACERALKETEGRRRERQALQFELARKHSWEDRFRESAAVWESILE